MKIDAEKIDDRRMHSILGGALIPRPIAFISTVGRDGIFNAAPYSLVMPVSWQPPIVCISFGLKRGKKKDTLRNIESVKDFAINIMDETFIGHIEKAAIEYPSDVDEIAKVGLTALACDKISAPRISEAQVSLECRLMQTLELGAGDKLRILVFGDVLIFHIKDEVWTGNHIDPLRLKAAGRLEGSYCRTTDIFEVKRSS